MRRLPDKIREELINFYRTSEGYGRRLDSHGKAAFQEYVSFVRRFAGRGDRILDIGCGTGLSTFMLGEFAEGVDGVDISPIFIRTAGAKYKAPNIRFECADALSLPFPDESYDVVSSFLFIEHIYDVAGALAEMVRVAKKGGLIIILSPNLLSPFAEIYKLGDAISFKGKNTAFGRTRDLWRALYLTFYKTALLVSKDIRQKGDFIYTKPILEKSFDIEPDNDAVYLSNPVDLKFWLRRNHLEIIKYQRETRWGRVFPSFATGIHIVARKPH